MKSITIPVAEVKSGDTLPGPGGWTAIDDATTEGDTLEVVSITVEYDDGGQSVRVWDDPTFRIAVER